jgi:hypothetical protein
MRFLFSILLCLSVSLSMPGQTKPFASWSPTRRAAASTSWRARSPRSHAAWGQPVVVENKPGANTILATDSVAKSPADGHTILMTTDATFSINPHLYSKLPFDTQRDFIR